MTASRDPDRLIRQFVLEGEEQLQDGVYDAIRAQIDHQRQRVVIGPWRMPTMNKVLAIGLGAAAVVVVALLGAQFLGSGTNVGGPGISPAPTASPDATPSRSPSPAAGFPRELLVTTTDAPVKTTVVVPESGWSQLQGLDGITKADDGLDPPESVGAALLAWSWPAGTEFHVYEDPCLWSTTIPESPATTPSEIAAAFAAQASTEPTAPVDVTVGGFTGVALTVTVPLSFDLPGDATREERFADCDEAVFGYYGIEGESEPARNAQGAGQIDELWILDVNGSIVILDATYGPATPADLVEELRAVAASATFEAP